MKVYILLLFLCVFAAIGQASKLALLQEFMATQGVTKDQVIDYMSQDLGFSLRDWKASIQQPSSPSSPQSYQSPQSRQSSSPSSPQSDQSPQSRQSSSPSSPQFQQSSPSSPQSHRTSSPSSRAQQAACQPAPTNLKFCPPINYPVLDTQAAQEIDEYLAIAYNDTDDYDTSPQCYAALKSFICATTIPKCSNGEELELCASNCIDFSTKCGFFFGSGWCLSDNRPADACTELLSEPALTCIVPDTTAMGSCGPYVNYPVPSMQGNNTAVWQQWVAFTQLFDLTIEYSIQEMVEQHGWSQATATACGNKYKEYYCRYTFFECKAENPYNVVPPCAYTCKDLLDTCPGIMDAEFFSGTTCLPGFGNLTCEYNGGSGSDSASNEPEIVGWSWSWGDPHLATLDGVEYEFNGAGEFWLTRSTDRTVQIQARFEPCGAGTCTTALAFCLGTNCNAKYTIAAETATRLQVQQNGQLISLPSRVGDDGIIVDPQDPAGIILSIGGRSGLIKVSPSAGNSLVFLTSFKPAWYGKLQGLLGSYNGIPDDDLTAQTESVAISTSATQEQIFNDFGLTWRVTEAESLFAYANGKTYASVNNLTYVPIFSDSPSFEPSAEAQTACSASGLTGKFLAACLFDVTVTRNSDFVSASQKAETQTTALPSTIDQQLQQINTGSTGTTGSNNGGSTTSTPVGGTTTNAPDASSSSSSVTVGLLCALSFVFVL